MPQLRKNYQRESRTRGLPRLQAPEELFRSTRGKLLIFSLPFISAQLNANFILYDFYFHNGKRSPKRERFLFLPFMFLCARTFTLPTGWACRNCYSRDTNNCRTSSPFCDNNKRWHCRSPCLHLLRFPQMSNRPIRRKRRLRRCNF